MKSYKDPKDNIESRYFVKDQNHYILKFSNLSENTLFLVEAFWRNEPNKCARKRKIQEIYTILISFCELELGDI